MEETIEPELSTRNVTAQITSIVVFTFIYYLTIGIPIAVLPGYVHNSLGFSPAIAGLVICTQNFATLSNRARAGRMADALGAKRTVMIGLVACGLSGLCLPVAAQLQHSPSASLGVLFIGRIILGVGESLVGTGSIVWGIGRVGGEHTARVISWNGINTYGAMGIGAPLGVWLFGQVGLVGMGALVVCLAILGLWLAFPKPAPTLYHGERMRTRHIANRVTPFGLALAGGSLGFGAIATFVTLYYASQHWLNPAFALTAFGAMFVAVRLLWTDAIRNLGGFKVAVCCLSVEVAGLTILALAPSASIALAGAGCTGAGFALLFPALGVEAVGLVPTPSRGAALGVFNVFLDFSLGATGLFAGWLISSIGYRGIYGFGAAAAGVGTLIAVWLWRRRANRTTPAPQLPSEPA